LGDVDYFKKYNDFYGHQQGDECLRQVAQALRQAVKRPTDLVARYGGEEFAVILPLTDAAGAVTVAQVIEQAVRELQLPHAQSEVNESVTVSLGVASFIPTAETSPEALIKTADAALYEAKRQGRDRWVYFSGTDQR
jgi:diguanylate cyclase (GGDEF)-like protein